MSTGSSPIRSSSSSGLMSMTASEEGGSIRGLTVEVRRDEVLSEETLLDRMTVTLVCVCEYELGCFTLFGCNKMPKLHVN